MTTVLITVDDALLKLADERAARSGMERGDVLADALRRGLGDGQLARLFAEARTGPSLTEEEAMALAHAELKAARAERRRA
jgi:metal-responsive CopG/Arc/MetJ family transcriptional regulator